jgi:hypothetical protein
MNISYQPTDSTFQATDPIVTAVTSVSRRYIPVAECAKILRKMLKASFPDTKFSVRSDSYSGGASIRVSWVDGPPSQLVEPIAQKLKGEDFDGMIDMASSRFHWLMPDGTVTLAHRGGTDKSRGTIAEEFYEKPSPEAELVSFGSDYVFCTRTESQEMLQKVLVWYNAKYGTSVPLLVNSYSKTLYVDTNSKHGESKANLGRYSRSAGDDVNHFCSLAHWGAGGQIAFLKHF